MKAILQFFSVAIAILAVALCNAPSSGRAESEPQVIEGWRGAKWGMGVVDVLAAFKGEAEKLSEEEGWKDGVCFVKIPKLELAEELFDANFVFDKEKRLLKQVVLLASKTVKYPEETFGPLEQKLTEKYGKPDFSSNEITGAKNTIITKKCSWKKGKTRIELQFFEIKEVIKRLTVTYEETPEKGDKNL
ncbi:MAG: hypothetical protein JWQ71_806 [Pedosphaera sp.]|nr:hypothetical protein [Pedosphaera sp.]